MALEALRNYKSLIVDYSIIREAGVTALFSEFLDIVVSCSMDIYVSKSFKLLHYCVIHQADTKNAAASNAMKDLCGLLLPERKLHSVQCLETNDFVRSTADIPDSCFVTTANSIFTKRILEKRPEFHNDICIIGAKSINVYHGLNDLILNMPQVRISPLASVNKYLDASVFCNVGDTVLTGDQRKLTLTKRVSSGAEGMVFTTDDPKLVAKIYHKGVITPLRWSKLTKMVSMGIKSVGICWPRDLIFYRGVPVGYTMILGKGKTLGNVFDGPDAMMNNFPKWTRVDITTTLCDLLEKYLYLHMHNIIAGDIQLKNALIFSANSLYLIDMDSVQVDDMPCPVGTEEFTDPRLWGQNFSGFLRKLGDEDYSIAMLVFSILFCGLHPYATRLGKETLREEIVEKNFPYDLQNASEEHIPKGGYNYIWQYLPENIRNMLYNVFKNGASYEAVEWYDAVLSYKEALTSRNMEDEEAYKIFPKMEYHQTAEAAPAEEAPARPMFKTRFQGLNDPNIYSGGLGDQNSRPVNPHKYPGPFVPKEDTGFDNPPTSPFAPPVSPFAAPSERPQATAEPEDNSGDDSGNGVFKKFKKGLFG